jgi:Sulfotransferase domain
VASHLKVVGAGLPRTGTHSLKLALERLIGGTCYHMSTLWERDARDVPAFAAAGRGEAVDWDSVFVGCTAAVDWPSSALWRVLIATYPDALVLLSERDTADAWWRSAEATVWPIMRRLAADPDDGDETDRAWFEMQLRFMLDAFGPEWSDADAAMQGYVRWNDDVRASVGPDRLIEWKPGMGWDPLCEALQLAVPDEPFPHVNTTEDFVRRTQGD